MTKQTQIVLPITKKRLNLGIEGASAWAREKKATEAMIEESKSIAKKLIKEVNSQPYTGETEYLKLIVRFKEDGELAGFDNYNFTRTVKDPNMSSDRIMLETLKCYELAAKARQNEFKNRGEEKSKELQKETTKPAPQISNKEPEPELAEVVPLRPLNNIGKQAA